MERSSPPRGPIVVDFILAHVFKLDPTEVRDALRRVWRSRFDLREDVSMPRIDPAASNIQRFMLNDTFQEDFDRWKAEVERAQNGTLEIVHEEPIVAGGATQGLVLFWRVAPRPAIARPRR
jgi:hypothetical protein